MEILELTKCGVWKLPRRHHLGDQHTSFFYVSLIIGVSSCSGAACSFRLSHRLTFRPHCAESSSIATYHPMETDGIAESHLPPQAREISAPEMGEWATLLLFENLTVISLVFSHSPESTYGNRSHISGMCVLYDSTVCSLWKLWTIQTDTKKNLKLSVITKINILIFQIRKKNPFIY